MNIDEINMINSINFNAKINDSNKRPLIVLTGPTAVGKTALSIELARALNGEIISADSMQVYRYMDIGTAKVTPEEMDGVRHYLIDELEPTNEFNVVLFQKMAKKAIEEIYSKGRIPIVAGGTGFYIQALLYDVDFTENDGDYSYRDELRKISMEKGVEALHEMLKEVDPKAAKEIHANNTKRVIRALEFYKQTGCRISEHNEEQRQNESPYDFMYFVLTDDRELLYERINRRVDMMKDAGLVQEMQSLIDMGCERMMTSMQGIGYKEFFEFYDGNCTVEDVFEQIKLDTRHFAKRQLTWFRREKEVIWIDYCDYSHKKELVLQDILRKIGEHYGNE